MRKIGERCFYRQHIGGASYMPIGLCQVANVIRFPEHRQGLGVFLYSYTIRLVDSEGNALGSMSAVEPELLDIDSLEALDGMAQFAVSELKARLEKFGSKW